MYIPEAFRIDDRSTLLSFMREHRFATVVSQSPQGLIATHVPLSVQEQGENLVLHGHFARQNPHAQVLTEQETLVIFSGPHTYVSPSWYEGRQNVPTWNYTAVHAYCRAEIVDDAPAVRKILQELTAREESSFSRPWTDDVLDAEYLTRMTQAIVAFVLVPTRIEGKFKLSQNRTPTDREHVASALMESPSPQARAVGELMQLRER